MMPSEEEIPEATIHQINLLAERRDAVKLMCQVIFSDNPLMRRYTADVLNELVGDKRKWQKLSPEDKTAAQQGILKAIIHEKTPLVRYSVKQTFITLLKNDMNDGGKWLHEIIKAVKYYCSDWSITDWSKIGSNIFLILAEVNPRGLASHPDNVSKILSGSLMEGDNSATESPSIVYNSLVAMRLLVPYIADSGILKNTYETLMPKVLSALEENARVNQKQFATDLFPLISTLADYMPSTLKNHFLLIVNFCLELLKNSESIPEVHSKAVELIGTLATLYPNKFIDYNLVGTVVRQVFKVMSTECETVKLTDDQCNSHPMSTAVQTMDNLVLNLPTDQLLEQMFTLLDSAVAKVDDSFTKQAVFLSIAMLAEGGAALIRLKCLEYLLNIIKSGIRDECTIVSSAAFFALGQFAEHLQPEFNKYAPSFLMTLISFLDTYMNKLRMESPSIDLNYLDRLFYAMEVMCEKMDKAIIHFLPDLVPLLLESASASYSSALNRLSLKTISALSIAAGQKLMPFKKQFLTITITYIYTKGDRVKKPLRIQAMKTLADLLRNSFQETSVQVISDVVNKALDIIQDPASDSEFCAALYNLTGACSIILKTQMASALPIIMSRLHQSICAHTESLFISNHDYLGRPDDNNNSRNTTDPFDSDTSWLNEFHNSSIEELEEAICTLKEFCENIESAFFPYIENAFDSVCQLITHPHERIRKTCVDALPSFIVAVRKTGEIRDCNQVLNIEIPKITTIISNEEEKNVTIAAFDALITIFKELGNGALPSSDLSDSVFQSIKDAFNSNLPSQPVHRSTVVNIIEHYADFDEVVEVAANTLPVFGKTMTSTQFIKFFDEIQKLVANRLLNGKPGVKYRILVFEMFTHCLENFKISCSLCSDRLLPMLLKALTDKNAVVQQHAVYGLGLLIYYGTMEFSTLCDILNNLLRVLSSEPTEIVKDYICGSIARFIIARRKDINLEVIMPVLLENLPLKIAYKENKIVFRCLRVLWKKCRGDIKDHLERIIDISEHVVNYHQYTNKEVFEIADALIKGIRVENLSLCRSQPTTQGNTSRAT